MLPLLAPGCACEPSSPRAAARSFLEASLRRDRKTMKMLLVVPDGTADEVVDLSIDAKLAAVEARRLVEQAAAQRFGAAAPFPRPVEDELRAVGSAPLEQTGSTAKLHLPGRNPLVLEKSWRGWRLRLFSGVSAEDYQHRMMANAAAAKAAAELAVHEIETGRCRDASCALGVFDRKFFADRGRRSHEQVR